MITAYVDDSGSEPNSPWFVLAGYTSTVVGWQMFEQRWRAILDQHPRIDYFHAVHAESMRPKSQWAKSIMTTPQRDLRRNQFVDVIRDCTKQAFSVRLKWEDYNRILKPHLYTEVQPPYYWLVLAFVTSLEIIDRKMGGNNPLMFVFDTQGEGKDNQKARQLCAAHSDALGLTGRIVDIVEQDDKKSLPLQAADFLAWQIRRNLCERPTKEDFDREASLTNLVDAPYLDVIDGPSLERLRDKVLDQAEKNGLSLKNGKVILNNE